MDTSRLVLLQSGTETVLASNIAGVPESPEPIIHCGTAVAMITMKSGSGNEVLTVVRSNGTVKKRLVNLPWVPLLACSSGSVFVVAGRPGAAANPQAKAGVFDLGPAATGVIGVPFGQGAMDASAYNTTLWLSTGKALAAYGITSHQLEGKIPQLPKPSLLPVAGLVAGTESTAYAIDGTRATRISL